MCSSYLAREVSLDLRTVRAHSGSQFSFSALPLVFLKVVGSHGHEGDALYEGGGEGEEDQREEEDAPRHCQLGHPKLMFSVCFMICIDWFDLLLFTLKLIYVF